MKKYILFFALALAAVSCKKENEAEDKVAAVPVPKVEVVRFDKAFFTAKPEDLPKLKQEFPYFFPAGTEDALWLNNMKDPFLLKLYAEVQKKFPNTNTLNENLASLFQHVKYYFPKEEVPKAVALVSDDLTFKSAYANKLVIIPLSLYLGKDNKVYEGLPKYQIQGFEPAQILPDIVSSFSSSVIAPHKDNTLLSLMIYYGKELYLKDILLPETPDEDKINYTKEQLGWAVANEAQMWTYFVENKLFYDNDSKLPGRFINPAPFTKFQEGFDNETPGRLGQWVGWQIVKSYMENNKNVTLQDLLAADAKTIFDNSKYKPKK
jgi:gliding motility-associated lipoprotein GldB